MGLSFENFKKGEDTLEELGEKYGKESVHFIQCDVTQKDDIARLYEVNQLLGFSLDLL